MTPTPSDDDQPRAGRPTATQAARLTERLRRAAIDTFLEHGYGGTTMEAVASAAGITKSTLYARYPDKRALFVAVSSWALTRQERHARVTEPLPDDLRAALLVLARAILARSVDPDLVRLSRMAIAESARFPEFAANSQAVTWSPRIQVVMDLLRRHQRTGALVVPDVELAAEQFFAMVGAMPAWLAAYGMHRTPEVEERHIEHAVGLFLNGVLTRGAATTTARPAAVSAAPASVPSHAIAEDRSLGRSGLRVAPLTLGVAALTRPDAGHDEHSAAELVRRYLDMGGNVLDATGTGLAAAERICGRAARDRRSEVVLATAVEPAGQSGRQRGNSRRHIREACEASLRRLGTDYIDLYQLPADDPAVPLEETVEALDELVRAGKVLYVGAADFRAYRLMKALAGSDRWGRARFVSLRAEYHPLSREVEREHFPLLAEEGLGFVATSSPDATAPAEIRTAAAAVGCTPAQLILAWQCGKPVSSVVLDVATSADLADAVAAWDIEIPAEITIELDALSRT